MARLATREPKIVLEKGKPSLVIINITHYQKLLEKVDDIEDLKELHRLRRQKLSFRPLTDFLKEHKLNVQRSH